jgi:high-mobility group nucleosome-binding domain-containing protein 2
MPGSNESRKPRRVVKPAQSGTDPNPSSVGDERAAEDQPHRWGDEGGEDGATDRNDERLRRDKPPHWS